MFLYVPNEIPKIFLNFSLLVDVSLCSLMSFTHRSQSFFRWIQNLFMGPHLFCLIHSHITPSCFFAWDAHPLAQFTLMWVICNRRRAWVIWDLCLTDASRLREHVENHRRACTQVLFLCKAELGFFHLKKQIVTGWLVPSTGQKNPAQPDW